MVRHKVRIRFRKAGDLRLVSHHDLMRCFERMLRRAGLPFHSTQGFNPKPRLVFALSLALGIVGQEEVAELELTEDLSAEEIHTRLAPQAPPGLAILEVRRIDPRSVAHVRLVCYRIALDSSHLAGLADRIAGLLATAECWVERTRPAARRYNLRPYLSALRVHAPEFGAGLPTPPPADPSTGAALEMDILVTPTGTARPEEVLNLLGLGELFEAGAVLERIRVELHEDNPQSVSPVPLEGDETEAPVDPVPAAAAEALSAPGDGNELPEGNA
jgi:radical SAM-linked protein